MHKHMLTLLLCILSMQVALQGTALVDDFHFLKENELFVQFVDSVRNEGNSEKAEHLREAIIRSEGPIQHQSVFSIRTATMLSRLYTELVPPQKSHAQELLKEAERELKTLEGSPFFSLILSAEIDSIAYLINPRSLGKGISSNSKINKAYEQFPNQVYAILMKASSLLYAPRIAGGNVEKALTLYLQLLKEKEIQLAQWDIASIYSSIGIIASKRKEWQTAVSYLEIAKNLYAFDPTLDEYLAEAKESMQ